MSNLELSINRSKLSLKTPVFNVDWIINSIRHSGAAHSDDDDDPI